MIDLVLVPLVIAGLLINGLRLRARGPAALPSAAAGPDGPLSDGEWIMPEAAELDEGTRRAAAIYRQAEGVDLLDLVPAGLPETAARDLVRSVDSRAYRADRLAAGRSAGAALLVSPDLLKRAEVTGPADAEPASVIELARRLRPYTDGAAIVIAPGLRSGAGGLARRAARLRASGVLVPVHLTLDVIPYALTAVALATDWEWGLAAAVAYCLQPYLIFVGTGLRPRGLHASALLRAVHDPWVWVRTVAGRWRSAAEQEQEAEGAAAADYYQAALAGGTDRFLEPPRPDCPWCGGAELAVLLRSPDLVMHKPGRFTLQRCGGCGHVFQNPRLTPEGLSFYYRDFYDGLGAGAVEALFSTAAESYRGRARMLGPHTVPRAWLDVGTGHGHFCVTAREIWPDTVFDGLDQGAGIEEAQRRGWVSTGHRGSFPELAAELAGRYDVVSMHHYLEHTREPLAELDAAARVLPAGGYLLIELPDPQWPLAPVFGRYWMAWFQPQHQHMMPLGNLLHALEARGLVPVATERGPAHQANDAVMAVGLLLTGLAPDRRAPWLAAPARRRTWRAWQSLVWTAGVPALAAGLVLDRPLAALARRWDRGDAYRVLARKQDPGPARGAPDAR